MSAPIFYISTEEYDALTPGATCALSGSEGKHALVKRLELGERIDLGDGTGRRALGTVASINADGVSVLVQELREERSVPSIYLVQALAKDGRDLLAIETATELGVYGVLPWSADRSIVRWKGGARLQGTHQVAEYRHCRGEAVAPCAHSRSVRPVQHRRPGGTH